MIQGKNYCISRENISMHEMIGLEAKIIECSDKGKKGISGKIIDETKNVFTFETAKGIKEIPKKECTFEFELGKEKAIVKGTFISERPEDRVKNCWRKKNAM